MGVFTFCSGVYRQDPFVIEESKSGEKVSGTTNVLEQRDVHMYEAGI